MKPDTNGFYRHCFPACPLWKSTGSFAQGQWVRGRCSGEHPPRELVAHMDGSAGNICLISDEVYSMLPTSVSASPSMNG